MLCVYKPNSVSSPTFTEQSVITYADFVIIIHDNHVSNLFGKSGAGRQLFIWAVCYQTARAALPAPLLISGIKVRPFYRFKVEP